MFEVLSAVAGILLVDIVLSGDNALVIGAAAARLPARQRRYAIVLGGAGAVVLRVAFATAATLLLRLPLLQALGGAILLLIAVRLLFARDAHETDAHTASRAPASGFVAALLTIVVADVMMSLDNVLAVGALANGHLGVLALGLLLSIVLVLAGSALVATLIGRLPWLLDVAALVLGWTAAGMLLHDLHLGPVLHETLPYTEVIVYAVFVAIVLAADVFQRVSAAQAQALVRMGRRDTTTLRPR
jgi:YjbE family integral membrane protein